LARPVDKALGGFCRRLKKAKGGLVATKAVGRKIALLYYRTLKHRLAYVETGLRARGRGMPDPPERSLGTTEHEMNDSPASLNSHARTVPNGFDREASRYGQIEGLWVSK
jgi:hypothetical protein